MAPYRKPGSVSSTEKSLSGPVSPGPTGRNDAGDPNFVNIPGNTPGPVGYNDGAYIMSAGRRAIVNAQTFEGFYAWSEASIADADDICLDATHVRNMLDQPYRGRLDALIDSVVQLRNAIDDDIYELVRKSRKGVAPHNARRHRQGTRPVHRSQRGMTPHSARLRLQELDDAIKALSDVVEAWRSIFRANLFELLAEIGQSRVNRARSLQREIRSLETQLQDLQRVAQGSELREAFVQFGVNTSITVSLAFLATASAPVTLAITIGATAVQLSLDQVLGPDRIDHVDYGSSSAGVMSDSIQAIEPGLKENASKLKQAGRALGAVGTIVGIADDANEIRHAAGNMSEAIRQLKNVASRLEAFSRELKSLLPILKLPELIEKILRGLQREAQILRDNGQVVLSERQQV